MTEALAILTGLTRAARAVAEIIAKAQAEGRDLTPEELQFARDQRENVDAAFEAELERQRNLHGPNIARPDDDD